MTGADVDRWKLGSLGLALALVLTACTEPSFRSPDAALDVGEDTEAGAQADSGSESDTPRVGDWAERLKGIYAVRAFSFARGVAPQSREDVLLVSIQESEGVLQLVEQVCVSGFGWNLGSLVATADLRRPETLGPRTLEITYDGEFWSTVGRVDTLGYLAAPPPECEGATSAPRRAEQVWLADTCICSIEPTPRSADDCRVTDPDRDREPGYALNVSIGGIPATYSVVTRQLDRYVHGTIDADGSHAAFITREGEDRLVGCIGTPCDLGGPHYCSPVGSNYVWFAPLAAQAPSGDAWSCAAVIDALPELFRDRPPPAFPQGC